MIANTLNSRWIALRAQRFFDWRGVLWVSIATLFGLLYWRVIPELVRDWYKSETFSYGFLIPIISSYLIWQRRAHLKLISARPSLWASISLLMSVALGLLGQAVGDVFSMRLSMVLALASSVYLLLGREFFKALWFPLFYLLLMIPAPYVLIKDLTVHLRYLDAAHAANILQLVGIPVFVEAYFIHIPNMTLEVADVCSGVSSVFALFALGTVYAYFLPVRNSLKILLVACTFPFAMIANLIRIVVIAVLAYNIGAIVFQSTFHWLTGTTVFLLALIMLISSGEFLRRRFPLIVGSTSGSTENLDNAGPNGVASLSEWVPHWVCIIILGGGLFFAYSIGNMRQMHLVGQLGSLANIRGFSAINTQSPDAYRDPTAEATLSAVATDRDNRPSEVFVGYRAEQTGGVRLRSPKLVFPDNWNSVWLKPAELEIAGRTAIRGNWILTRKGDSLRLVLYWYQFEKSAFAGEFEYRLWQLKRALIDRRSDGAVVRLATPVVADEPIEKAQERLRSLGATVYHEVGKLLPR